MNNDCVDCCGRNPVTATQCVNPTVVNMLNIGFPNWCTPQSAACAPSFIGLKRSCVGNQASWYSLSGASDTGSFTQIGLGQIVAWGQLPGPNSPNGVVYLQQLWAVTGNIIACPPGTFSDANSTWCNLLCPPGTRNRQSERERDAYMDGWMDG